MWSIRYRPQKAASQSKYSSKLENVSSCTARDALTVVFNLSHTDEYFVRLLDFPIFEKETEKQVNSDNKSVPPIGSEGYVFGQQNDKFYLEANQNWIGGHVNIAKINLVNLPTMMPLTTVLRWEALTYTIPI